MPGKGGRTMKKLKIVSALFFILYFGLIHAQDYKMGVVGGINIANMTVEEGDPKSVIAMAAGMVVDIPLNEYLYVCFQPMLLQKGSKEEEAEEDIVTTLQSTLSYLELPVYFKLLFSSGDARPYVFGGFTAGYLFSSKLNIDSPGLNQDIDTREISESFDYGLIAGAGIEFVVGQNFVFFDCRYNLGFADVFKGGRLVILGAEEQLPDQEITTKGIQVFAGISFPFH